MTLILTRLIFILLYCSAGFCIYIMFLNRYLILIPDSKFKGPLIYSGFVITVCGGVILGFLLPSQPWVYIPIVILCAILIGEIYRMYIRKSCSGNKPVESSSTKVSIKKPITTTDIVYHRFELTFPEWRGL